MVRKSTRAASLKAHEKTRRESPRRRQRRSSSRSEDSDEDASKSKNQAVDRSEKGSSDNESDIDSKKPLKKRTRSMAINDVDKHNSEHKSHSIQPMKDAKQDKEEEVTEENISKGKSKSISNSNNDNVEPGTENENMQVTDESPHDAKDDNPPNDELSKNGMESSEIDVNISQSIVAEMTCDNQSSEVITEQTTEVVISEHAKSSDPDIDENSSDLTQANVETIDPQIAEETLEMEKSPHISSHSRDNQSSRKKSGESSSSDKMKDLDVSSSHHHISKERARFDSAKKIKLNRLTKSADIQPGREEKIEVGHDIKKKITLKRPTSKTYSLDEGKQEGNQESSPKEHVEEDNWGSSYERTSNEGKDEETPEKADISGEKRSRKRITLKRSTIDDASGNNKKDDSSVRRSLSLQEKTEARKSPSSDNIVIKERIRRSSTAAEKSMESEGKLQNFTKPSKVVKLVRKLPEEPQEPPPPGEEPTKIHKWGQLGASYKHIELLTLDNLQEVCSDIEFVDEEDVDLELVIRETRSPEKVKRKTFKELEEEEMENIEAELNAEPEEVEIKENIIAMNRKISIVDDTASKLKPPPSPARNPISQVLFITNLVRPFTVKQLKELLGRTGKIKEDGFWTDRIKSKCYVYYETAEEAESTRNALHGVHWPIGNGKKLIIDYATLEDMENARNPPVIIPKKQRSPEKENKKPVIEEEKHDRGDLKTTKRERDADKESHRFRRSHSRSRERRERKHSRRSYTPEDHHHKRRKPEEPIPQKAMDDLFLKTKATPSIYWQPLSPEEIARKQQQRQARLEENKRRLEEIRSSGRGGIRDRSGRDRNFRRR